MIKHWEILENKWTQNSAYVLGIQGDDNDSQIILRDLSSFCSLIDAKAPNFTHLFELLNISDDDILQKIRARIEDIVQKNSINRKDVSLSSTPLRASGGTLDFVAESADPLDNILSNGNTFRDSLSSSSDGQEINLNVNASLHLENTNVDAAPAPKEKTIQQETPVQPELEIKEPTPVQEPVVEEKIDRKEGTFAMFKKFFSFGKKKQAPKEQAPAPKKPEGPLPIEEFVAKTEVTKNDLNVNNTDKKQTKATDEAKKEEHKTMRGVVVKGTAFPAEELGAQKVADVSLGKNILDKEPVKDQSQNLKSQVPLDDIFAAETICQFYDDKNSSEQPKIEKIEEPTPMPTPRVITITQNRILEENLKNEIKKEEKPQVSAEVKKEEPAASAQPVQNKVVAQKPAVSAPAPAPILTPAPKAPVAETPKAKAPVVPVRPEPAVKKPVAAPAPKVPAIPAVSAAPSMPTLKVEKKVNQPVQQENTNNVNSDKKVSKMPQITISEDEALKIKNIAMKEKTFTTTNKEPAKAVQQNKPAPAKPAPAAPVAPKAPTAAAPAKPAPAAPVAPKAPAATAPAKPAPVAPKPAAPQAPAAAEPAKPAPVAPVAPQAPAAAAPAKPAPAAPATPQAPATNDAAPGQASKPIPMPHVKQEQIDGFDHTIQTTSIPVYKKSNWPIEMPIVPSFTLESMDMSSNRFAHAAAMTIVENPGSLYNPFFVFGEGGCGKTHFLNAIGSEFTKRIPLDKIFITNGVRFSRGVQRAIENGTIDKVKEFLDSAQVLIIDDIHLTAVNETNKDFISQVLNDYVAKRKQLVIASKYPPQGLSRFEELTNFKLDQGWISELKTLRPNHFLKAYMRMILDAQVDLTEAQCRGFFGRENLTLGLIAKDIKRIKVLSRRIQDSGSTALSYEQLLNYITAINGEDATSQLESLDLSSPLSIRRGENTNWGNFGFFFPKESMDKFKWMVYATMQRAKELGIKGGFNFALKSAYSTEHIIASAFKIANVCDSKNLKAAIILGPDPRIIQPAIRDNFCDILSHMLEVMMIRCAIIPYEDIKKPSSYVKVLGDVLK